MNRKIAPSAKTIDKINIINPSINYLDNKIPVYSINGGSQDIVRIELVFDAGTAYQKLPLISMTANKTLMEGSSKYSAQHIAETLDYYGAFLEADTEKDHAVVVLYSLHKHLNHVLPVFEDIIKHPNYPNNEISVFLKNQKQQHIVNVEKVNYLARLKFGQLIFGESHPYGKYATPLDFDHVTKQDLEEFHKKFYGSQNCKIILSGKIPFYLLEKLNQTFGQNDWSIAAYNSESYIITNNYPESTKQLELKNDALQSAIRIGKVMFNKSHKDYHGMVVLNTILGGYFGSRLMLNIREEKGYTYGIGSGMVSLRNAGYFFISSEVGVDVTTLALDEIYKEINKLQTNVVPIEELSLVKNYLMGVLLKSLDGPFALADKYRDLIDHQLNWDYYQQLIVKINTINQEEILNLAKAYLNAETLSELVVGKK